MNSGKSIAGSEGERVNATLILLTPLTSGLITSGLHFHNLMLFLTGAMTESYLAEKKEAGARQIMERPQFQSKLECHRRCHMRMKAIWSTGSRA